MDKNPNPMLISMLTAYYQKALRLDDWQIYTYTAPANPADEDNQGRNEVRGQACFHTRARVAHVTYLETLDPETLAEVVAHEMVHVRLAGLDAFMRGILEMLPEQARDGIWELFINEIEYATKALGLAFAELHPVTDDMIENALAAQPEEANDG